MEKISDDNPIPDFFTIFQRWLHFTCILVASVTTLHLQASADAALSYKPVRPVTRSGHSIATLIYRLAPHRMVWFGADLCVLKCAPGLNLYRCYLIVSYVLVATRLLSQL